MLFLFLAILDSKIRYNVCRKTMGKKLTIRYFRFCWNSVKNNHGNLKLSFNILTLSRRYTVIQNIQNILAHWVLYNSLKPQTIVIYFVVNRKLLKLIQFSI